jgi:hypothetical protein
MFLSGSSHALPIHPISPFPWPTPASAFTSHGGFVLSSTEISVTMTQKSQCFRVNITSPPHVLTAGEPSAGMAHEQDCAGDSASALLPRGLTSFPSRSSLGQAGFSVACLRMDEPAIRKTKRKHVKNIFVYCCIRANSAGLPITPWLPSARPIPPPAHASPMPWPAPPPTEGPQWALTHAARPFAGGCRTPRLPWLP